MDITKKEGEFEVILSEEGFFDPVTDESDGAEENSEAADGNSAENSEAAAENSEAAAENAEAAAENAEVEAEIAEAADENSEAADGNSEAADGNSEAADENSEVTDGIAAEENSESPGISFTESEEASGEEMRGSTGQAESDRTGDALTNTGAVESDAQEQPGKKKSRKGLIAALVFLGILAGGIAAYLGYGYIAHRCVCSGEQSVYQSHNKRCIGKGAYNSRCSQHSGFCSVIHARRRLFYGHIKQPRRYAYKNPRRKAYDDSPKAALPRSGNSHSRCKCK